MDFSAYFKAVLDHNGTHLMSPEIRRVVQSWWPSLVARESVTDYDFQFKFLHAMIGAFSSLPAHRRVHKYLQAWYLGRTDDDTSISNLAYLNEAKYIVSDFMHFAESAEVLEAFQPFFDEAEALISRAQSMRIEEFSAAAKDLRKRILARHSEVRSSRPGLIKWDPDGLS